MLHNRLVCGINDDRVQCCLLAEPNLTFKKAYELAQAMQMAEHDARELQGMPAATVNKLDRDAPRRPPTNAGPAHHKNAQNNCYRCGGKHPASDCKFHQSECWFCKKIGYIEKVCRSKLKQERARGNTRKTYNLSVEDTDDGDNL